LLSRGKRNKEFSVSLYDQIDHNTLIQTSERNEQCGLYLVDGNAYLDENRLVYSAIFSSIKYGKCNLKFCTMLMLGSCMKEKKI